MAPEPASLPLFVEQGQRLKNGALDGGLRRVANPLWFEANFANTKLLRVPHPFRARCWREKGGRGVPHSSSSSVPHVQRNGFPFLANLTFQTSSCSQSHLAAARFLSMTLITSTRISRHRISRDIALLSQERAHTGSRSGTNAL
jgi:hypothetical protein